MRHTTQYFELLSNRGVYDKGWMANTTPLRLPWAKAAPGVASPNPDDFQWELHHVAEDFSQANTLAAQNPASTSPELVPAAFTMPRLVAVTPRDQVVPIRARSAKTP